MHDWSETDFDWNGLNCAIEYIAHNLVRWGRVGVRQYKEKYGTARIYCSLGWTQLFCITHPGYVYSRYPKWLWSLDVMHLTKLFPYINKIVIPYHSWLYRFLYKQAVKKWPHLHDEILCAADYPELLEGL